jgi:thiol-disulfide isomerase/thioredoxin
MLNPIRQRILFLLVLVILTEPNLSAHQKRDVPMKRKETGRFAELRKKARDHIKKIEQLPKISAPDFPEDFRWLFTDKPLSLKNLRGHVVLLDFWTYGCINCMHVVPELQYLEEKYREAPFLVIGVHSAKFNNERDAQHIQQAADRLGISHPVVVDEDFRIWSSYAVRAWPTLVLIGPDGNILATLSGEGHRDLLDALIAESLNYFGRRGQLARKAAELPTTTKETTREPTVLRFPGKLVADESRNLLYLSDTGNHRILILDPEGEILGQIGSGILGWQDGPYSEARFNRPQGLILWRGFLWVADTDNHLIRRVDLQKRSVKTVAGTGKLAFHFSGASNPGAVSLNSPWDLAATDQTIFIAMAGTHQIWAFKPEKNRIYVYAGTGMESREDGDRWTATFAQPSGLATDGTALYVADSESSSLRAILLSSGKVVTLAGGDLFDFGDRDGPGTTARFQHPLGIFCKGTKLLIADTYNHKIREFDLATGRVTTLYGDGHSGFRDGTDPQFFEPSDVVWFRNRLYVVDTGNHAIRCIDPDRGVTRTLKLRPGDAGSAAQELLPASEPDTLLRHPSVDLKDSSPVILQIRVVPHSGLKISAGTFLELEVLYRSDHKPAETLVKETVSTPASGNLRFIIPQKMIRNGGELELLLKYVICEIETGLCRLQTSRHRIPVTVSPQGKDLVQIQEIPGPRMHPLPDPANPPHRI